MKVITLARNLQYGNYTLVPYRNNTLPIPSADGWHNGGADPRGACLALDYKLRKISPTTWSTPDR